MALVLVTDDDHATQALYSGALEKKGHTVFRAGTGREALDMLQEREFEVMVLDVRMPDMHGLELLEELRKSGRELQVILSTSLEKAGESFEAKTYGIAAFMQKPVDLGQLCAKVAELAGDEA